MVKTHMDITPTLQEHMIDLAISFLHGGAYKARGSISWLQDACLHLLVLDGLKDETSIW